jgi:hypothetical protein
MANAPLFMGGLFNYSDPILNQPLYIYLWLMLIALSILCWLGWRYGSWKSFEAMHGLYYAFKAGSQAAFVFNSGLVADLVSEKEAKNIFDYSKWSYEGLSKVQAFLFNYATIFLPKLDFAHAILYKFGGRNLDVEIAKSLQNFEWEATSSVVLGGTHVDLVLDSDRWSIRESPQHEIVESLATQWNDANPTDQIHAYPKFQKYLIEGKIDCPPGIIKGLTISWTRIDQAFPINVANSEAAGPVREMALEMEQEEAMEFRKYYFYILGGGLGFAILIVMIRFISMKFL